MSKRNLVIIIALLVIIDIAAALWYLSLRIEASGESHNLWESAAGAAVVADTLTTTSVPDSFSTNPLIEFKRYYVSKSPAIKGDERSYYVCIKQVKARWPQGVNGNDSLPALERALLIKLFGIGVGNSYPTLQSAAQRWLEQPRFTIETNVEYRSVDTKPHLIGQYGYSEQLLVYPILTSLRLLVMQVDHNYVKGDHKSKAVNFVHYDRVKQSVLDRGSILEHAQEGVLLSLINEKIERLNHEKRLQLERAYKVANEFHAVRAGIIFVYPAGEIAPVSEGNIDILLDYPRLSPALTQDFKNLLHLNDGYWNYKPINDSI